ncbi:MAG: alpha/beta hydrolase [Bacteroidales bacterium]
MRQRLAIGLVSSLVSYLVTLLTIAGCSKTEYRLDEVIHIRHQGADMPAYIHGNFESKTFIVVLHGAGSFGLSFRDGAFTEVLEENYVVVYWDQRGQGMSQGRYGQPDDLVNLMADDVIALATVLRSKYGEDIQLFLMGHSWGGALGTTTLLKEDHQNLFSGWISVSGVHDFPLTAGSRRGQLLSIANEQISLGSAVEKWQELHDGVTELDSLSEEDYQPTLQYALQAMKLLYETEVIQPSVSSEKMYRAIIDNNPVTWMVSNLFNQPVNVALADDYSLSARLPEITLPALLIYGKYDVSVPPVIGQDAYERLGSAEKELLLFEHSIHHPHDTEPDRFAEEVVQFVEKHR